MKKWMGYILVILWLAAAVRYIAGGEMSGESRVAYAFADADFQRMEYSLSLAGYLDGEAYGEEGCRELLEEIFEDDGSRGLAERRYLSAFVDMEDETLYSVYGELAQHLMIFNDADVRYQIQINPNRVSPEELEEGNSIFFQMEEYDLDRMSGLLQLVLNQLITHLEHRSEDTERPCLLMIDELARICAKGRLSRLESLLATGRSRKVSVCLISQSFSALRTAYTEQQIIAMAENCRSRLILQASSLQTQKEVIEWAGSYLERKTTWVGGNLRSTNVSYEENKILRPEDLVKLPVTGECILIHNGYYRIGRVPYYQDKHLKKAAEENRKHNDKLKRRQ